MRNKKLYHEYPLKQYDKLNKTINILTIKGSVK